VRGVFVRWLNQTKMINIENKDGTIFVYLTKFGENIYQKYKQKYISVVKEKEFIIIPSFLDIKLILEESSIDKQYLRLSVSSEINNRTGAL